MQTLLLDWVVTRQELGSRGLQIVCPTSMPWELEVTNYGILLTGPARH